MFSEETMTIFFATLKLMAQGMLGIFIGMILIMITVYILGKITAKKK
ncbi:MAG TPA: sodium pump decarboxylase gamma subunit [Bacillota bacterium]|nr:sodium pump decarboxylase gamma subunit [Bacillota bacterium]